MHSLHFPFSLPGAEPVLVPNLLDCDSYSPNLDTPQVVFCALVWFTRRKNPALFRGVFRWFSQLFQTDKHQVIVFFSLDHDNQVELWNDESVKDELAWSCCIHEQMSLILTANLWLKFLMQDYKKMFCFFSGKLYHFTPRSSIIYCFIFIFPSCMK